MLPPEPDYAAWITWLCDKNMNLARVFFSLFPALNADGFCDGGVVPNISVPPEGFCPSAPPVPLWLTHMRGGAGYHMLLDCSHFTANEVGGVNSLTCLRSFQFLQTDE